MEDRFQNALNVSLLADRWVLTDTTGRTHTVVFEGGVVSRVVLSTFAGDATWELNHRTVTLPRDFKDNWFANTDSVQVQWLNAGNIFGLGHDKDFLLGDPHGTGKMTIQGRPPFFLSPQPSFVTTRGRF